MAGAGSCGRARAWAAGLAVVLPGGLWTNIPVTEPFAQRSPYAIHGAKGRYLLRRDGQDVAPPGVRAPPLPGGGALLRRLGRKGPRHQPWIANGEIIAGLEPPASSIRAIDWITSVGAVPTVCVFRSPVGTDLAAAEPPQTEEMVPIFRRLYEACMERGPPIGCAPNVHVSLVLLPEECRSLEPAPLSVAEAGARGRPPSRCGRSSRASGRLLAGADA